MICEYGRYEIKDGGSQRKRQPSISAPVLPIRAFSFAECSAKGELETHVAALKCVPIRAYASAWSLEASVPLGEAQGTGAVQKVTLKPVRLMITVDRDWRAWSAHSCGGVHLGAI